MSKFKLPLMERGLTKEEKLSRLDSMWGEIETKLLPQVKPEDRRTAKAILRKKYDKLRRRVERER